jgi:hypothetical protein
MVHISYLDQSGMVSNSVVMSNGVLVNQQKLWHDVSSPQQKIQFTSLSSGQIGVRLIHICFVISCLLSLEKVKKLISQIVRSLKSRELN